MSHHRFLRAAGTPEIDANIRNPRIYCVNSYFLMFSGSQVQTSYLASKNDILTFRPWHHDFAERIYTILEMGTDLFPVFFCGNFLGKKKSLLFR